jgi:F-box and WD-40 domain protein 1/11
MPAWAKADASAYLDTLMFFDPVAYLPYELVSLVFGHLSPSDLLNASSVSRGWREHTHDEELWRNIFAREGWHMDIPKIRDFERRSRDKGKRAVTGASSKGGMGLQRKDSRKRRAGEAFSEGEASAHPADANGAPSADSSAEESSNEQMEGVELGSGVQGSGKMRAHDGYMSENVVSPGNTLHKSRSRRSSSASAMSTDSDYHSAANDFKLAPTLLQDGLTDTDARVSWAYLYKQRRLLERNWDAGKYQMFRLPHLQYPEEGHDECVYTIQHAGEWLVSGSRDRTIRIWDLTTSRLRHGQPAILKGHVASVLCLQFDASPENDIIVSGGSDSWVIIWRFSTGEIIKKMDKAHTESVLNLRFDHRYIVTCSKDKTIKIWNRHTITCDSPLVPAYVVNQFKDPLNGDLIMEHSLLSTLTGHGAAVNAVMIHNDTIVSASGDRTIKAWNIQTGKCEKQYIGHTKGIACVQYDGRRIISGSSDNTVRIFDADRQVEVACLTGHSNLVRTVQARFGDLETISDEELYTESRQADIGFYKALDGGMKAASTSRGATRNAGSSRPEHMLSTGAKIPPGGGGSRWAKIISGSYDESIIIWKKDKDGKWVHRHRLRQDQLLRESRPSRNRREIPAAAAHTALPMPVNHHSITLQNAGQPGPQQQQQQNSVAQQALAQVNGMASQLNNALQQDQQGPILSSAQLMSMSAQQRQLQANLHSLQNANAQRNTAQAQASAESSSSTQAQASTSTAAPQSQHTGVPTHPPQLQPGGSAQAHAQAHLLTHGLTHAQAHAHAHAQAHANLANHRESSNRVFKLQFDARRVVCCSQNKVIVGWDFANGDADLKRVGSWSVETC